MCLALQRDLFALGARLADPAHKIAKRVEKIVIDDAQRGAARRLDRSARRGDPAAAPFHPVGRLSRPAPRCTWRAPSAGAPSARCCCSAHDAVEPIVIIYINRLSDLLFTMARAANHRAACPGNALVGTTPPMTELREAYAACEALANRTTKTSRSRRS